MSIRVKNVDELKLIAAMLHDARFTADSIAFDPHAQTFALKCWTLERKLGATVNSRNWTAYQLLVENVSAYKFVVKENVSYYEIATIRIREKSRKLELVSHYGIEICMDIGELEASVVRQK